MKESFLARNAPICVDNEKQPLKNLLVEFLGVQCKQTGSIGLVFPNPQKETERNNAGPRNGAPYIQHLEFAM